MNQEREVNQKVERDEETTHSVPVRWFPLEPVWCWLDRFECRIRSLCGNKWHSLGCWSMSHPSCTDSVLFAVAVSTVLPGLFEGFHSWRIETFLLDQWSTEDSWAVLWMDLHTQSDWFLCSSVGILVHLLGPEAWTVLGRHLCPCTLEHNTRG